MNTIKVGLYEAEDRLLSKDLCLAWVDATHQGSTKRRIMLEFKEATWDLVLYVGDQSVAHTRMPMDRVWTIRTLMQSAYFLGMVEQMKLLAHQEAQDIAKNVLHAPSPGAEMSALKAIRTSKWALGMSAVALAASLVAASVGFYSLKVGLSAHVNAAVTQPRFTDDAVAATVLGSEVLGAFPGLFGGDIRVDGQTLGAAGIALLTEAAASTGFSLNDQGQMVVMFSDPLCPACQQFESWIAEDQYQTFSPLMVPVALRPGAREVAAAVICSQNQAKDWASAIAGVLPVIADQVCEEGLRAVDRNNEIFRSLGFTHTPTFVAMNGRFMVGAQSPQDMRQWAGANASAAP